MLAAKQAKISNYSNNRAKSRKYISYFFVFLTFVACQVQEKNPNLLNITLPKHFPALPQPAENPMTQEGVALGKKLFFDKKLSGSKQIACASCHQPQKMFTDGVALSSKGHSGKTLPRHTPSLVNVAWVKQLFWDGGATNLESLAVSPLTSPDEMNKDLKILLKELAMDSAYNQAFRAAFATTPALSTQNILRALAQYQRTLVATNTTYDLYLQGVAKLNPVALEGLKIVEQKCMPCHSTVLFSDNNFHNNGLDTDQQFSDQANGIFEGRGRISLNENDKGKFKTPTLRNVMLTAPYMHDGRFATIDQVLNHYAIGVKLSKTLSKHLINKGKLGINLNEREKKAIVAFLHTLSQRSIKP
jgi:cytochrome c peroxidase